MTPQFDVFVVGDYCLDFVFSDISGQPKLGTEVIAKHFNMTPGGTCNSVIAMHRLGLKVSWAVDFGSDSFSRFILDYLGKEGIDPGLFVHTSKAMRKVTVSLSYPEDRAFIAYYDPEPLIIAGLKMIGKADARLVYIPGIYYGIGLDIGKSVASRKKMLIAMDGNTNAEISLKNRRLKHAISILDVLFLNASEAIRLTGEPNFENALRTCAQLCPLVVIKNGSEGAYACHKGNIYFEDAIKVKAKDTTGAGDCFNAGFIKAWLDGKPVPECLKWGNIVGGLSTLGLGGVDHVTREADVQKWLKKSRAV